MSVPNAASTSAEGLEPGRYRHVRMQPGGRSREAVDEVGRRVVLKPLEADCMLKQQLHPMVRDRLERVRELAHVGVAQLYGVEREGEAAYLVWERVGGKTLDEHLAEGSRELAALRRGIIEQVGRLHALGIVHGALHERNIIVEPGGAIRLTHISPLLYTEERADVEAMEAMFVRLGMEAADEAAPDAPSSVHERQWGLLLAAGLVAVLGGLMAWGIWNLAQR